MSDPAMDRMRSRGVVPAWQCLGLGVLSEYVPAALIDEVLAQTGGASRRVRLLPARVVVLFVLALTLFSGYGYRSVWRQLAGGMAGLAARAPTSSALTQARQRLGPGPLAALFARVRGVQAGEETPGAFRFGLRLVAWDATMLDVPDTEDNAAAFPRSRNGHATGGFPQARLLALIEVGSHAVIDAAFGCDSEQVLARRVLGSLQPGMLLLADRNLCATRRSVAFPAQPGGIGGVFLDLMAYPGSKDSRGREHASKPVIVSRRRERCAGGSA